MALALISWIKLRKTMLILHLRRHSIASDTMQGASTAMCYGPHQASMCSCMGMEPRAILFTSAASIMMGGCSKAMGHQGYTIRYVDALHSVQPLATSTLPSLRAISASVAIRMALQSHLSTLWQKALRT